MIKKLKFLVPLSIYKAGLSVYMSVVNLKRKKQTEKTYKAGLQRRKEMFKMCIKL